MGAASPLPALFKKYRIVDGRKCKLAEKWARRPDREPYSKSDMADAAVVILENMIEQRQDDVRNPQEDRLYRAGAKITGVWGTGSGPAGKYTRKSDIDTWIRIKGITHAGSKVADQNIVSALEEGEYGEEGTCVYAGDECRRVDAIIDEYGPDREYCSYNLAQDPDVADKIDEFNAIDPKTRIKSRVEQVFEDISARKQGTLT